MRCSGKEADASEQGLKQEKREDEGKKNEHSMKTEDDGEAKKKLGTRV